MQKKSNRPARRARNWKPPKVKRKCDPGLCDHCIYIGDGDFICDRYPDENGNPAILVVENWMPNANYLKCKN